MKVVIIGGARYLKSKISVGKTSLMRQYVNKEFTSQYKATIGADFLSKEIIKDGKSIIIQIWDTAGQEKFQSVQSVFYKGADACMIVFDLTSLKSFEALDKWKSEFISHTCSNVTNFPFVLIGNKSDLDDDRKITETQARSWCAKNGNISYYETSAKTSSHVVEAFEDLTDEAIKSRNEKRLI